MSELLVLVCWAMPLLLRVAMAYHRLLDQCMTAHAVCFAWNLSQMGFVVNITVMMACFMFQGISSCPTSSSNYPLCFQSAV